jgi:O-antigen/teichoic acid export membrane protein
MSVRKHTAYNLIGAMAPIAVSLVAIPIYIRLIGEARYGVLATVGAFLGYFGIFDLGLGAATAQRIASIGDSSPERVASNFWTALIMNGALGLCGGALVWPLSVYFFTHVFNVEAALRSELVSALPWLSVAVPVMTVSGVLVGTLQGRSKFLELNIISGATTFLMQTVPLFVAWAQGPDLSWLLPATVLTSMSSLCAMAWRCGLHVTAGRPPSFDRDQARSLLSFGGWVTVSSVVGPLMVVLDRFAIGATMGTKAVAYYTVPFQLASRSTIVPNALTSALFPRLAQAGGTAGDALAIGAIRLLAAVMTLPLLGAVLLITPFLQLWIGFDFAANANGAAQVLLLGFWINGLALVPFQLLQAMGRPRTNALIHLVELLPYLVALYGGLRFWGLLGAAIAFTVRVFADMLLLSYATGLLRPVLDIIRFPATVLVAGCLISMTTPLNSAVWWAGSGLLLLATLAWSWRRAPAELQEFVARFAVGKIARTR